jgi:hypothetical protein
MVTQLAAASIASAVVLTAYAFVPCPRARRLQVVRAFGASIYTYVLLPVVGCALGDRGSGRATGTRDAGGRAALERGA